MPIIKLSKIIVLGQKINNFPWPDQTHPRLENKAIKYGCELIFWLPSQATCISKADVKELKDQGYVAVHIGSQGDRSLKQYQIWGVKKQHTV